MRIISRLDIKGHNLIKGVKFEGLRVLGCPIKSANFYYKEGIDEILCIDTVASLYGRNNAVNLVKEISKNVFLPITVCGGIRSVDDGRNIIKNGADKIGINTAAVENQNLITELVKEFGSQSIILSVEAKKISPSKWEVYTNSGRDRTGLDVKDWIRKGIELGAGSILLTSIDRDGTQKGFDIDLCSEMYEICEAPLVISGGMGKIEDIISIARQFDISGLAMGSVLHYENLKICKLKEQLLDIDCKIRT
tara:strand:- start:4927 stop:5676 length:750 start_codon:yes stop_codon:yes gene_type:complete